MKIKRTILLIGLCLLMASTLALAACVKCVKRTGGNGSSSPSIVDPDILYSDDPTPDEYFIFKYLSDTDSYEIKQKSMTGMPPKIVIPSTYNGKLVTSIGKDGFYNCNGLTIVSIPDSVTSIGDYAFKNCLVLKRVTIGSGVTSIGTQAFCGCERIESVSIPDSVTSIGAYAFRYCRAIKSVTIGSGVTSIGGWLFGDCVKLTNITVGEENENYKSIDGNLYGKDGAVLIQYAIGKTDAEFEIPDSVTSIAKYAFHGCVNLTGVSIPDGVTSIGEYAFYGCANLTSVSIPDGVTIIDDFAFYGCANLTSVTMGSDVRRIGRDTFYGCRALTSVTYGGTMEQWESINKDWGWMGNAGNFTVICAEGTIDKNGVQVA